MSRWPNRLRAARHEALMTAMMERTGVDPQTAIRRARGPQLDAAARRCQGCEAAWECGRWLEDPASRGADAPGFCPNADFLARARLLQEG